MFVWFIDFVGSWISELYESIYVCACLFETEIVSDDQSGDTSAQTRAALSSAQRLAASSAVGNEVSPDPFGREAKHYTEVRVLNRDVRIVLEGVDKFSNLIGSVYYPEGEAAKELALELVENGLAKYVEWSASLLEDDVKRKLKKLQNFRKPKADTVEDLD
ncbi:hypothetical protein Leryth_002916 [Lithospermum erythrorhizon]|nr:hypothetical protein Leryth_002916 [Lithospermum erythrorhizon]